MCGVLQGSVFELFLFNLFINDIINISNKFKYMLLADDTNMLCSMKTADNVENIVNIELSKI